MLLHSRLRAQRDAPTKHISSSPTRLYGMQLAHWPAGFNCVALFLRTSGPLDRPIVMIGNATVWAESHGIGGIGVRLFGLEKATSDNGACEGNARGITIALYMARARSHLIVGQLELTSQS